MSMSRDRDRFQKGRETRRGEEEEEEVGREVRSKAISEWADDRGVPTICIYVRRYEL
jgi:hypothetical protein